MHNNTGIKMHIREIESDVVDWIQQPEDGIQW